jgi:hypothetical protein
LIAFQPKITTPPFALHNPKGSNRILPRKNLLSENQNQNPQNYFLYEQAENATRSTSCESVA